MARQKPRGPGRVSDKEAKRTYIRILDAAEQAFVQRGFHGATIRDIADAAAVNHSLVRHHTGTKDELWWKVLQRAMGRFDSDFGAPLLHCDEPPTGERDQLELIVHSFLEAAHAQPAYFALLLHEAVGGPRSHSAFELLRPLCEVIASLVRKTRRRARGSASRPLTPNAFLLLLLFAGALPCALPSLSNPISHRDFRSEATVRQHARRVTAMLLGESGPRR